MTDFGSPIGEAHTVEPALNAIVDDDDFVRSAFQSSYHVRRGPNTMSAQRPGIESPNANSFVAFPMEVRSFRDVTLTAPAPCSRRE